MQSKYYQRFKTPEVRFWEKVLCNLETQCWEWTAFLYPSGYGHFQYPAHGSHLAHRFSYELVFGAIPIGLTIDHLCRVRHCVNPEHLEAVSLRTNTLRGKTITARNAVKTHCLRGHPYDLLNTYLHQGRRHCRECNRLRQAVYLSKRAS